MQAGTARAALFSQTAPPGGRVRTACAPDLFQVCLQGRLVCHLQAGQDLSGGQKPGGTGRTGATGAASSCFGATGRAPGASPPAPGARNRADGGFSLAPAAALLLPPQMLPELAVCLVEAGAPAPQVQEWLAQPRFQERGVTFGEVQEFLSLALAPMSGAGEPTPAAAAALPPQLQELVACMARQPEAGLKIPRERMPEVAARLLSAGLPARKVEALLTHPGVQESGLTPEQLLSAWQQRQAGADARAGQTGTQALRQSLAAVWDKVRFPAEALPDLKLALQKLGVPPEALAALGEETGTPGVTLAQVAHLLRQVLGDQVSPQAPEEQAQALAEALAAGAPQDAETWRQLLLKTGLAPAAVDTLWGGTTPGTQEELRIRLLKLVSPETPLEVQETPKPVYLPQSLRLSGWNWPGQDEHRAPGDGREAWPQTPERSPAPPAAGPETQPPSFLSSWSGAAGLPPGPAGSPGVAGPTPITLPPALGQAVWDQVQAAVINHLKPGQTQLTVTLNPPELGQVALTLLLEGQHLRLAALTARPEVAHLAQAQVKQLVQALSQQGIILTQFSVQAQAGPQVLAGVAPPGSRPERDKPAAGAPFAARSRALQGVDCFA